MSDIEAKMKKNFLKKFLAIFAQGINCWRKTIS